LWSLPAAQLGALVADLERIGRRVAAAQLAALAQADSVQIGLAHGATSTAVWLRNVADVPVGAGKARLALHAALTARPAAAAALAAGAISVDAAAAVCAALDALPAGVPAAQTGQIEGFLVDVARDDGTRAVVHRAAQIGHRFAPDILEAEEKVAREHGWLTLTQCHDGAVAVRGLLDKEAGALALAVLSPLAAPAPSTDAMPDLRPAARRWADAFAQLCQLATPALPDVRGDRPHVLLTISFDALQGQLAAAPGQLERGAPISAAAARRLACDANLIPIVLGAASQPLDIGRATRIISPAIRRALTARDGGCVFPGCDRPPSWCDAHHNIHWAAGGPTALANLYLLCGHHHDTAHHHGWTVQMINGLPWFIPPPWIDPTQTPRLRSRFRVRELDPIDA
jgi:Domain of unknown function (DUF222)